MGPACQAAGKNILPQGDKDIEAGGRMDKGTVEHGLIKTQPRRIVNKIRRMLTIKRFD
jgi:hypothetical protein